jgi:hypothetical protein
MTRHDTLIRHDTMTDNPSPSPSPPPRSASPFGGESSKWYDAIWSGMCLIAQVVATVNEPFQLSFPRFIAANEHLVMHDGQHSWNWMQPGHKLKDWWGGSRVTHKLCSRYVRDEVWFTTSRCTDSRNLLKHLNLRMSYLSLSKFRVGCFVYPS